MPAAQGVLAVIKAVAPKVVKYAGPELTKWLAKSKNRQALADALRRSGSRLPAERLKARIQATILVLQSIEENAGDSRRIAFAQTAKDRANRLLIKLELPFGSRAERRANAKAVAASLSRLHEDMNRELDEPDDAVVG